MSQGSKSAYYQALKGRGVTLEKHYRDWTTEELVDLAAQNGIEVEVAPPRDAPPPRPDALAEVQQQIDGLAGLVGKLVGIVQAQALNQQAAQFTPQPQPTAQNTGPAARPPLQAKPGPIGGPDPLVHAGVTLNTHGPDEPVRIDELGNAWFQNEVQKPGYAKPRGRRVLRTVDRGVVKQTITTSDGSTETFEIPGDETHQQETTTKVTLPSFQTGIYKAPGIPFKIHTYQGVRGFDFDDVNRFYGGADMVPDTIKRCYVSYDLCYDMTTTIRAIKDEERELVLKGKIR